MATSPGPLPTPVVPVAWLRDALQREEGRPVVLDVRWTLRPPPKNAKERKAAAREDPPGLVEHDAGHVPGAVYVDLDTELAGPPGPAGRHPLPDPDVLEETLQRAGADRGGEVVVYDGGDGMAAARAWWVLRWAGLPHDRVAVLDGGFPAWVAAGGEVTTTGTGVRRPGSLQITTGSMPVLTAEDAAGVAGSGEAVLLDGRAPERFRGETEPLDPVAGHVPGAASAPAAALVADGHWRDPEGAAEVLRPLVDGAGTVGAYCGSGVSAAMLVLGLEHAGLRPPDDPAGLYVGSWSHWCGTGRPVETGA
ncbi:rhodanese-like domain-containing protein [Actinomycetospora sp. NBRC 106375]|uniref:sulfurtransferase n=1 Tax=Actinomycetospora sp. NBRC 106375 TaxID=3032207 RepID=UPI00255763A9|nr:rhodanese-like domain-containing protein [Actinomycetospora sp. NBRC 106375]